MGKANINLRKTILFIVAIILSPSILFAQSPWMDRQFPSSISIEWYKPVFNPPSGNEDVSFFSSVLFVTGRYQATEKLWLVGDLPLSHWEYDDSEGIST